MSSLGMKDATLRDFLEVGSIFKYQLADTEIQKLKEHLERNPNVSTGYYISEGILKRSFKNPDLPHNIIVPRTLVPFVLAYFHLTSHAGTKKMRSYIRQKYYWPGMIYDIDEFAKGCILCAVFKHSSTGKGEIGVLRKVLNPRHTWQMDIVNGMGQVKGYIAYITFVDVYSGYVVPVALKSETSAAIAQAIEESIIKVFGPPDSISSDNAANLSGIEIRKLLAFYNINRQYTTPYAPESHGLVENCNRFITQLTRIYSDQFRAPWIDVLTLAAVTINSVPRQSLNHHSPHFIMFNEGPAQQLDQTNFLNTDAVIEKATNNKVFAKLLREYLLLQRQRQNAKLGRPYLSFPPGTLIYSKDFKGAVSRDFRLQFFCIN